MVVLARSSFDEKLRQDSIDDACFSRQSDSRTLRMGRFLVWIIISDS